MNRWRSDGSILDAWSRKVVGWAMANDLKAQPAIDAMTMTMTMTMAVGPRRPRDVIHHSDQGSQHTSVAFGLRCKGEAEPNGVRPSMGSLGGGHDDATRGSVAAALECEPLDRRKPPTRAEARMAPLQSIKGWHDPARRHPASGCNPPVDHERTTSEQPAPTAP